MSKIKEKPKRDRKEYMKKYQKERYESNLDENRFIRLLDYYIARDSVPRQSSKLINMCKDRKISVRDALQNRKKEIRTYQ